MDTHRSLLRLTLTSVVLCLALAGGLLPAQASAPGSPTPEPSTSPEPDASLEQAPEATPDVNEQEPAAPSTTQAEQDDESQAAAAAPTEVTLVRSAGTTSPQEPVRGRITATSDGKPLSGAEVRVVLAGPSPRTVTVTTLSNGAATYSFERLRSGSYTVHAEVVATEQHAASTSAPVGVVVQSARWVSLLVNSGYGTVVKSRENFWLRGRVLTTKGAASPSTTVRLYRYSGSKRTKVATLRTSSTGWFSWSPADRRAGTYRAVVSDTRFSAKQAVRVGTGTRTLSQRASSLAFLLGEPTSPVRSGAGRTWRTYAKGVLVQSGTRTWVVRGSMLKELDARKGPGGTLGAPTGDVRCGLPEGGCLQQFRTGAIYANPKAKDRLTSATSPTLGAADLVAVARSQVGYRESSPRKSKYNKWIGRTGPNDPWCGFFVSWLAHAGGKPGSVLKKTSYKKLLDAERKRGRTSRTPKVGRLAYIGYFSKGTPSHVGIVSKVSDKYVWTIEGNVSARGGQKHPRGVHEVKRTKSRIVFYADPKY